MLLLLLGCPSPTCPEDTGPQAGVIDAECACETPSLRIGTGSDGFEELGAELEMVNGPQGGWHLTAAALVGNTRDVVTLETTVTHVETGIEVTGGDRFYVQLVPSDTPCEAFFPDMNLILFPEDTALGDYAVHTMTCTEARIDICATDSSGRHACDARTVFVQPDPDNVEAGLTEACP